MNVFQNASSIFARMYSLTIQCVLTGFLMAESLYRTIVSMQPTAAAHFALAGALRASGNVTGSIAEMETGLARDPRNVDMRVRLGQTWQHFGAAEGLARATEEFKKVLELDGAHVLASSRYYGMCSLSIECVPLL